MLVLVDQPDMSVEEPSQLVAEPRSSTRSAPADRLHTERSHELGKRLPQDQLAALGLHRFGANPGQQEAWQAAEGELVIAYSGHDERVGAVDALVLFAVAGVGAGQAAQRHHPRHETEIGFRFAGRDKLVHLIGIG